MLLNGFFRICFHFNRISLWYLGGLSSWIAVITFKPVSPWANAYSFLGWPVGDAGLRCKATLVIGEDLPSLVRIWWSESCNLICGS
jgi:hypothetical protein